MQPAVEQTALWARCGVSPVVEQPAHWARCVASSGQQAFGQCREVSNLSSELIKNSTSESLDNGVKLFLLQVFSFVPAWWTRVVKLVGTGRRVKQTEVSLLP